MKIKILKVFLKLLLFLHFSTICCAQNLIPNYSFENYTGCPSGFGQLNLAAPWFNPTTGINGVSGTPDYLHSCSTDSAYGVPYQIHNNVVNYQAARTGNAFAGIFTFVGGNYREYISVPLDSQLVANTCYEFNMYFNLWDNARYNNSDIGVYFSDTLVVGVNNQIPLPFAPQIENSTSNYPDTATWKLVSGTYLAHGGESSLIIGNFKNDINTDTILLNSNAPSSWFGTIILIDDVSLIQTSCTGISIFNGLRNFELIPNPAQDYVTIKAEKLIGKNCAVSITDIAGKKLKEERVNFVTNKATLDVGELKKGIYFLKIETNNGTFTEKVIKAP